MIIAIAMCKGTATFLFQKNTEEDNQPSFGPQHNFILKILKTEIIDTVYHPALKGGKIR